METIMERRNNYRSHRFFHGGKIMSGVNGIGAGSPGYVYSAMSSGSRVNTAAQGASEMAILQEEERQVRGTEAGTQNMESAKSALNIADGAASQIADQLQRMRELAIQASNGTLNDEDKAYIQNEIEGLKSGIAEIADKTNYNGVALLDNEDGKIFKVASNSDGSEKSFTTMNATLSALGLEDFDVTGDFDIKKIDEALSTVSKGRSSLGAQTNSFEAAIRYNNNVVYNTTAAQSRTGDTEYGDYIQKLQKQKTLNDVSILMQRRQMEDEERKKTSLFE